jgi:hypothetical protein
VTNDRLSKFYDRFQPEERFRLTLEALARGDEEEAERLSDSCPRRTYTMNDLAYGDKVRGGLQITMVVCLHLTPSLAQLRMIRALRAAQPSVRMAWQYEAYQAYLEGHRTGSCHAWRAAGMEGDPPGWEVPKDEGELGEGTIDPTIEGDLGRVGARVEESANQVSELLNRLERKLVAEVRIVWEAFAGFCHEELGSGPETLLGAYVEEVWQEVEELGVLSNPEMPNPDSEELAEYREILDELWIALPASD